MACKRVKKASEHGIGIKKALILAGGQGTRLRPLTYEIPKALIPVHGKSITEHMFELLRKYGVTEIYLSVGYLKERIKNFFKDGAQFGMDIYYIEEDKPLGTGGPLLIAKKHLTETFIVTNGDELKNIDIDKMYDLHRKKKALVTIALTTVEDVCHYGVARMDKEDKDQILEFVEKPKKEDAPSNLISSGFYIMEPEVIKMIPKGFAMLEKDVFPKIAGMGRLYGHVFKGQFYDAGTMERYDKAIKEWIDIK